MIQPLCLMWKGSLILMNPQAVIGSSVECFSVFQLIALVYIAHVLNVVVQAHSSHCNSIVPAPKPDNGHEFVSSGNLK